VRNLGEVQANGCQEGLTFARNRSRTAPFAIRRPLACPVASPSSPLPFPVEHTLFPPRRAVPAPGLLPFPPTRPSRQAPKSSAIFGPLWIQSTRGTTRSRNKYCFRAKPTAGPSTARCARNRALHQSRLQAERGSECGAAKRKVVIRDHQEHLARRRDQLRFTHPIISSVFKTDRPASATLARKKRKKKRAERGRRGLRLKAKAEQKGQKSCREACCQGLERLEEELKLELNRA